jgi:hypothetical protein
MNKPLSMLKYAPCGKRRHARAGWMGINDAYVVPKREPGWIEEVL